MDHVTHDCGGKAELESPELLLELRGVLPALAVFFGAPGTRRVVPSVCSLALAESSSSVSEPSPATTPVT